MDNGNRLFVPLASEPYQWFKDGNKRWELRRYGRQYTEKHVRPGRRVELRRGYSDGGNALWGTIRDVEFAQDVDEFFDRIPFKDVVPDASSRDEAIAIIRDTLRLDQKHHEPVLGFEVVLDK